MRSSLHGTTGTIDGRRKFLQGVGFGMLGLGGTASASEPAHAGAQASIVDYGAIADGKTNNAKAIQLAIETIAHRGGGVVYVPPGRFLTGGIELRSHITLYLEAGAVLLGSQKLEDYLYHPGPLVEADANGRHLVFARDCEDVEIAGLGTIDGQGRHSGSRLDERNRHPEIFGAMSSRWTGRKPRHVDRPPCLSLRLVRICGYVTSRLPTLLAGRCGRWAATLCSSPESAFATRTMRRIGMAST